MDGYLQHLLLDRLSLAEDLPEAAVDLILAACEGPEELRKALGGESAKRSVETVQPELAPSPPGAYLRSIAVQGFRGIGPQARLELDPGPGLTLVVGRNGSGKSSFAEALELVMTGENSRWANRTKVWSEGWQNLHADGETVVEAELHVDGQPGLLKLCRRWARDARLDPGRCDGMPDGWAAALSRYRPFLSYNELGSMFDELRTMYDALAAILGLEDIDDLQKALREVRLDRERAVKALRGVVKDMIERHEVIADDRVAVVVRALRERPPDLAAIEHALEGTGEEGDPHHELAGLREIASLQVPDEEAVAGAFAALDEARAAVERMEGTDAAHAASLVALLETALRHDEAHREEDCPVCGTAGVIDDRWRARTAKEVGRLAADARAVEHAQAEVTRAERRVADLLAPAPPRAVTADARDLGLSPQKLESAWEQWAQARTQLDDPDCEALVRAAIEGVEVAARSLAGAAAAELDRREDVWRPVARELGEFLPAAQRTLATADALDALKAAEAWVRATAADLQAQRLAPIADAARENWAALRQESNVSLDGFHLRKSGNTRSAEVDVKVDGSEASAFGVMSQGELHALAVSVFLPRAAMAESPFRFLVIDDPVQSMDPAKVDGLARVLEGAAKDRQVIVFTHDERLPEAVRRLNVEAAVLEVTRRPRSIVQVRRSHDPVRRSIEDARALLREERLPAEVARRVVPGFCRQALEHACITAVRRRRLVRGEAHADVEGLLDRATTLYTFLALALFDDPKRTGDVLTTVNNRWGTARGDLIKAVNKGAHGALDVQLELFVDEAARFAVDVAKLP